MEIGFFFWPYDVALVGAMAEAADAFGYDMVGIADTPGNAMDPWVATTLLAARTRRARVAVCVSNLVTRHPAVSAASIASIDLLAPGRALLGIGVGHSGTRNLGKQASAPRHTCTAGLRGFRFCGRACRLTGRYARDRITIRLRPGDRRTIRERARKRGLKDSAYIAALVRAHVSANPPLTEFEVEALKASVVVLAGVGRLVARMSREAAPNQTALLEELRRTRECVADVERYTCNLIRAALESWESHLA